MEGVDFKDIYIGYEGHPAYQEKVLVTDDPVRIIIQKYEMLLFTNKEDILGNPDIGCDLENLLWQSRLSAESIEKRINTQVVTYIPEITSVPYDISVEIVEHPTKHIEIMIIQLTLGDNVVTTLVGDN